MDLFGNNTEMQTGLDFPQPLTERYRPQTLNEFVGLEKPKKVLSKLIEKPFSSAWLLVGPSGTGKTTMSLAIAAAVPAELHHIPSQNCNLETIERVCRTCNYVPMSGKKMHLVLVDEADRMTDAAQVALLSKLDSTAAAPNTIWIFTCNGTDRLEARFLSRLRILDFSSYGIAKDAAQLLDDIWTKEAPAGSDKPNFARIVKESNNNVRESMMRLETELMSV